MDLWQECVCACNFLHYNNVNGHPFYSMLLLSEYLSPYQASGIHEGIEGIYGRILS